MKTKFDDLLKIKKSHVSECERKIKANIQDMELKRAEIDSVMMDLNNIQFPQNSDASQIMGIYHQKKILTEMIDKAQEEYSELKAKKRALEKDYNDLQIEAEKIKYLQTKEIENILKMTKIQENRQSDQIATFLFKKRRWN